MSTIHAFHVRHRNGWGTGIGPAPSHCAECGDALHRSGITTGYGCEPNAARVDASTFWQLTNEVPPALKAGECIEMTRAVCFECCGRADLAQMRATGRGCMYLSPVTEPQHGPRGCGSRATHKVSNWPGTLSVPAGAVRESRGGGFGARRRDTWFCLPGDPFVWHGVNRGDNDILRCKRTKERA